MARLHVSCYSASYLAVSSAETSADHGLLCLLWRGAGRWYAILGEWINWIGWRPPCWELSLTMKHLLSYPLLLSQGKDVNYGWNASLWLVRRVVCALRRILCYLRRGFVVSYLQLIEAVLQRLHLSLSLCCCCMLYVANN